MPSARSSAEQRHVLILGLTFLVGISAVIIVFERVQKQEANMLTTAFPSAPSAIAGEEFVRDRELARYRQAARSLAVLLFANISRLEQGQSIDGNELEEARRAVFNTTVPALYQKLHFKLLKILNNLTAKGAPDLGYLIEQRTLLQEEFPWL